MPVTDLPATSDLVSHRPPPPNRERYCADGLEAHLTEGAVMLAFALFLLDTEGAERAEIHPDGEHGKRFDIAGWLISRGFERTRAIGSTSYGGEYVRLDGKSVIVDPKSGLGDVVAEIVGEVVVAECKGGVINTTHPGQKSRLYSGLCETVGMLMAKPEADREYAVVPATPNTRRLAERMVARCRPAGIIIALVHCNGHIEIVSNINCYLGCFSGWD